VFSSTTKLAKYVSFHGFYVAKFVMHGRDKCFPRHNVERVLMKSCDRFHEKLQQLANFISVICAAIAVQHTFETERGERDRKTQGIRRCKYVSILKE
jgi:hypothetical protein